MEMNTAPDLAPASTTTTSIESEPLTETSDIAAKLKSLREVKDIPKEKESKPPAQEPPASGDNNTPSATGAEEGTAEASQEDQPEQVKIIPPPASWTKEDQVLFSTLPQEIQQKIAMRETEREKAINSKLQEAAAARQEREQVMQWAQSQLMETLQRAHMAIEGEFAGINWRELQMTDPETFLRLDAMRKQRLESVEQAIHAHKALTEHQQQQQGQELQAHLKSQVEQVLPALKELIGDDFNPQTYKSDLTGYLTKEGVPEGVVGQITNAWELKLATKAMLYDRMMEAKRTASVKVAEATPVQRPKGKADSADHNLEQYNRARQELKKNPNSTENIFALLKAKRGKG